MSRNVRPSGNVPLESTGGPGVEREFLAVVSDARLGRAVGERAVAVAPAAHHVEAFEREARRVDLGVAGGAGLQRAMLFELCADGRGAAGVGLDGRHAGRRRGWRLAEDALHDPRAAQHRRGRGAVGGHLEHAGLGQQAAARAVRRQRHAPQGHAFHGRQAIVRGEPLVEHGEIGRDEVPRRQVAVQQLGEEQLGLLEGRLGRAGRRGNSRDKARRRARWPRSSGGRASNRGRRRRTGATFGSSSSRSVCARSTSRRCNWPRAASVAELLVRRGVPEEQRQPCRQRVVIETARAFPRGRRTPASKAPPCSRRSSRRRTCCPTSSAPSMTGRKRTSSLAATGRRYACRTKLRSKRSASCRGSLGHHLHRRVRAGVIGGFQRQVAEEQAVSRRRPLVVKRPLDLEPAERHAGAPVLLRERIPVTRRPRAEQPRGVGTDRFAGEQPDVELLHRRLRPDVEAAEPAEQARGRFGIDRHRLGAAAGGNVVQVGNPPLLALCPARPTPRTR